MLIKNVNNLVLRLHVGAFSQVLFGADPNQPMQTQEPELQLLLQPLHQFLWKSHNWAPPVQPHPL